VPTANGPLTDHDALVDWVTGTTVIAIDSEDSPSTRN
jgi:hypothetical protein